MQLIFNIGRHTGNDLVIKDQTAEEFHAAIEVNENLTVTITDFNTRYGTFVDGNRIKTAILKNSEIVQIGFTRIYWRHAVEKMMLTLPDAPLLPHYAGSEESMHTDEDAFATPLQSQGSGEPAIQGPESVSIGDKDGDLNSEPLFADEKLQVKDEYDYQNGISRDLAVQMVEMLANTELEIEHTPDVPVEIAKVVMSPASSKSPQKTEPLRTREMYLLLYSLICTMLLAGWLIASFL